MNKSILLILVLIIYSFNGNAQTLNFKHFTVADNLPSNICYKILQDEKGYIWIATEKGIVTFNGYDFKPLRVKNKLGNLDIYGLFKDADNRVWLKSKQSNNIYFFQNKIYTIDTSYVIILEYGTQILIFKNSIQDAAIYSINNSQKLIKIPISVELKKIIIDAYINYKMVHYDFDDNNIALLLQNGDYIKYSFKNKEIKIDKLNLSVNSLLNTKIYNENIPKNFYFSTKDSIYYINNQKIISLVENKIKHQKFIGVTTNYFFSIQNNELKVFDKKFNEIKNFLPKFESSISQIYEDKEQNLWIVTIGNGIYFIANKALRNEIFQKQNGLLDNNILSIELKNKKLLLGYYSQSKIQEYFGKEFVEIEKGNGIANQIVSLKANDIIVTDNYISNEVKKIVSTNFKINIQKTTLKNYNSFKLNLSIKSIFKLNDTSLLVGSLNKLLLIRKSNQTLFIDSLSVCPSIIYSICKTKNQILLGTSDGLYTFKNNSIYFIGQKDEYLKSNIRSIVVDRYEKIWIASDYGNLTCYDKDLNRFSTFKHLKGLITSLNIDTFNNCLLASSSYGLFSIELKQPNVINHYTISDGLPSNEVNITIADKNYFYVATSMGLCKLNKNKILVLYKLKLNIEKLLINNIESDVKSTLQIKYNQNNVRIDLAALSFQSFGQIKYYYRLYENNKNKKWTSVLQRSINFSSLEPGDYVFEAYAKDINNLKSNTINLKLSIVPPFWKTTLFYFLMTFLLVGIILLIIYFRLKKSKETAVSEMTIKKEFAELKLTALQSQLNSHFIYNSLNAIQKFILDKDEITASEYMSKFAKMIRLFLESSRSKLTPLSKEIELISIYTLLEKLRFGDKFDIFISTEDLKDKNILFPTNLLQPFIENAIIHGLMHKSTKGRLEIYFSDKNDEIYCRIEDDGIGRIKSSEMNNNKKRKSFGMDIIQDKIINIEHLHDMKIKIDIIDKNIETHLSTGTIINVYYKK